MSRLFAYVRECYTTATDSWNEFWFAPARPLPLAWIRILTAISLLYAHAVWTVDWRGFFGSPGWLSPQARQVILGPQIAPYYWSHFDWIDSPAALWLIHLAGFVVLIGLLIGYQTRACAVLAWLLQVSYAHRNPLANFGLDAVHGMLAMYLMVGPSGAAWSVDEWMRQRSKDKRGNFDHGNKQSTPPPRKVGWWQSVRGLEAPPSSGARLATRLIQCHMCLIYLFSALGKIQGQTWWQGTAIWGAVGNLEYQAWDATWLANYPLLGNFVTHLTVVWELAYCVLIWPRLWRPVMLFLAVGLHVGIGLWLGMLTFGLAMLIGNLAFVLPEWWEPENEPISPTSPL
ncbi:MAG: HTTM domain-containing protein [Pirellulales bacterium]|nr:HTTM domain-containing protein [Pirellulales bacterium]